MKKRHAILLWAFWLVVVVVVILILIIFRWIALPYRTPLVVNNFSYDKPIHVKTPVVHPGDVLRFDIDYCKHTDAPATVYRTLIDGQTLFLLPREGTAPKGCRMVESSSTVIPDTINPGRYYLYVEVWYQVNPLRKIPVRYYTEYFQVVDDRVPSTSSPPENGSTKTAPPIPMDMPPPLSYQI